MAQREEMVGVIPRMEFARQLLGITQEDLAWVFRSGGIAATANKREQGKLVVKGSVERWLTDRQRPDADVYEDICIVMQAELRKSRNPEAKRFKMIGRSYYVEAETGEDFYPFTGSGSSMNISPKMAA